MSKSWKTHSTAYLGSTTALAFDPISQLLWTGSSFGQVASHFIPDEADHEPQLSVWSRYTAYKAHLEGPTKHILVDERGILSLSDKSIKMAHQTGRCLWQAFDNLKSVNAMCYTASKGSEVVVAGSQTDMVTINTNSATTVRVTPTTGDITHLDRSQNMICCGLAGGTVGFRDPRTMKEENSVIAHYAGLSELRADGHLLITCGYSLKQGNPIADPMVKVFDIRTFRSLAPVAFPAIPAFVRFHPRMNSNLYIASATGQFQTVDLLNPSLNMSYTQLDVSSYINNFEISSTGAGIAYSDADGMVHLSASTSEEEDEGPVAWSRFNHDVVLPAPVEPLKSVDWTIETPLSEIGMPFYTQELCSNLPEECLVTDFSPLLKSHQPIDPDILANVKVIDGVGYAVYPRKVKRYQAIPKSALSTQSKRKMKVPLFRSEKGKENTTDDAKLELSRKKSTGGVDEEPAGDECMPAWYHQVEIKYSKFGIEDFDFSFYNRTSYSGLETHIANAYINSLVQLFYHTVPLQTIAISHTNMSCQVADCILCELGFLFRMLKDAKGVNCQATNFLRAFTSSQRAASLHLMDSEERASNRSYSSLIQLCHHFLMEQIATEVSSTPISILKIPSESTSAISSVFGVQWTTLQICPCGHSITRQSETKITELLYPRKALSNEPTPASDFPSILKNSFLRETTNRMFCSSCSQQTHQRWKRSFSSSHTFPSVLAINTAVSTSEQLEYWLDHSSKVGSRFLQPKIGISLTGQKKTLVVGDDVSVPIAKDSIHYELQGMIAQIQGNDDEPPHLVTLVKVPGLKGEEGKNEWYLFNDFLVRPISEEEALSFPGSWKIPAILYYTRVDSNAVLDLENPASSLDASILQEDTNLAKHRDMSKKRHVCLASDEILQAGSTVAIDAEFVSLQQEEVDYKSDGSQIVHRPSRMTLARVSVLRGSGPKAGVPFIDDHILTNEPIADYLTEFSGIRPGDLDVHVSRKTLVTLKNAYKKLRLLVDLGCVFIGHGLSKDFRIINIHVPPHQIMDTVALYHIAARHRKLSLRFLSYVVLEQDIQNEGTHDSIEDAHTALHLYQKWKILNDEGNWDDELEVIYHRGKDLVSHAYRCSRWSPLTRLPGMESAHLTRMRKVIQMST